MLILLLFILQEFDIIKNFCDVFVRKRDASTYIVRGAENIKERSQKVAPSACCIFFLIETRPPILCLWLDKFRHECLSLVRFTHNSEITDTYWYIKNRLANLTLRHESGELNIVFNWRNANYNSFTYETGSWKTFSKIRSNSASTRQILAEQIRANPCKTLISH